MRLSTLSTLLVVTFVIACGPGNRKTGGASDVDAPAGACSGPENTPETCSDGIDNDCNGLVDCADPSCSGIGSCPVCGTVQHPTGMPVDLPDGVGGNSCTTDADCASVTPGPQHCFDLMNGSKECRQSYTSTVQFTGFAQGQKLMQVSDIESVCVTMSHEWVRDLEIDLITPDMRKFKLDKFEGQMCGSGDCEVYLGHPLNTDGDCSACTQEMGFQYCFKPGAANPPLLQYADMSKPMDMWNSAMVMPAGDYQASDPFTALLGTTLNGKWTIAVTDLWPIDAGKLHSWTISFNPAIVQDCSGPVIQ